MSGSITDAEFTNALEQVLQIVHAYNHRITVVECDNEVRRYLYDGIGKRCKASP